MVFYEIRILIKCFQSVIYHSRRNYKRIHSGACNLFFWVLFKYIPFLFVTFDYVTKLFTLPVNNHNHISLESSKASLQKQVRPYYSNDNSCVSTMPVNYNTKRSLNKIPYCYITDTGSFQYIIDTRYN